MKKVRIGGASAFYGDSQLAARQLVDKGDIDYLVFDYLAEITMGILAKAKARDERQGYAVEFVTVAMQDVISDCAEKGIKVIANAGGVNVPACVTALQALCTDKGLDLKIAGVYGDDLSDRQAELAADLIEMETGAPLPEKLASLNVYLGAQPIAEALTAGADIIVTGRVVDSAVVIGPLMHEYGWQQDNYDALAQAALAGHILECGAQCTGGNFTDWHLVPDFSTMSYPVAEFSEDATFEICIPPNTGGLVNVGTVGEQMLYEIGDPANYLLPDVACDFTAVNLQASGTDRVHVSGARGRAPGQYYKACATWIDGYRLMGMAFIGGPRAAEKARSSLNAWVQRTEREFEKRGLEGYRDTCLEVIGAESTYGPHAKASDTREVMAKYGLHHNSREALGFASREFAYLATSAAPGMSGFGGGRAQPSPLIRVHSALLEKSKVPVTVQLGDQILSQTTYESESSDAAAGERYSNISITGSSELVSVPLEKLAYARSGDKGDIANIGVIARKPEYLPWLYQQLTAKAVADYFAHLVKGRVDRYELPGINGFNFLMREALGGGGSASLRIDPQAKAYAQMLLSMEVKIPEPMS
ncbi:acyclic terpene utilization AtuA family protein [Litorivivens sp.]|uniref:acyclic terpene utilization AtuA family protein n=2 Tax=Litorivivens sp. TaxID=2020868 RepID=UPI0035646F85